MNEILSPKIFLESAIYNGSLWKYPKGTVMGSDLDQFAEKNGYFLIAESKQFWFEQIIIPFGQIHMLRHLNNSLPKRKIFIIGTDSYNAVNDEDSIWFRTLDEENFGDFGDFGNSLILQKSQMIKTTKQEFNRIANRLVGGMKIT